MDYFDNNFVKFYIKSRNFFDSKQINENFIDYLTVLSELKFLTLNLR